MSTSTVPAPPPGTERASVAPPSRVPPLVGAFHPDTLRRSVYGLASLPLGILWFVWVVTGLSVGAALAVTLLGFPVLFITWAVSGAAAELERRRARALLGLDVAAPPRRPPSGTGAWARFRARAADLVTWRELGYHVLSLPLGILTFTVVVVVWTLGVGFLSMPTWAWAVQRTGGDVLWAGNALDTWWEVVGVVLLGALILAALPIVVRGVTAIQGALVRGLLGASHADLSAHAARLESARGRSVDAAAAERRRIERDLHDGAQARLVNLAMDLGRARERLDGGASPEEARAMVADAHEEAKRALAELRDLARGIHPAVLTDRGLDAALSALAARAPVPVDVRVDLPSRPPAAVEGVAYFVVAEALANVARHSGASSARVRVAGDGSRVVVEVADDGVGGADPARGSGLAGLADRVASVDGHLTVMSPAGGPTSVIAELPCA